MWQQVVGDFQMGPRMVQLVAREETGGECWVLPGDVLNPRIKVGVDGPWPEVVGVLLHETMELSLLLRGCRFERSSPFEFRDTGAFVFMASHVEYSEACLEVGAYMALCLPSFAKVFDGRKKRRK